MSHLNQEQTTKPGGFVCNPANCSAPLKPIPLRCWFALLMMGFPRPLIWDVDCHPCLPLPCGGRCQAGPDVQREPENPHERDAKYRAIVGLSAGAGASLLKIIPVARPQAVPVCVSSVPPERQTYAEEVTVAATLAATRALISECISTSCPGAEMDITSA